MGEKISVVPFSSSAVQASATSDFKGSIAVSIDASKYSTILCYISSVSGSYSTWMTFNACTWNNGVVSLSGHNYGQGAASVTITGYVIGIK